jgi:hypothetical protein
MRVEKQPEVKKEEVFIPPQPMGKIVVLMVLAAAASLLFWFLWSKIIETGISFSASSGDLVDLVIIIISFCLMFTLAGISSVLISRKLVFLILAFILGLSTVVFFRVSIWSVVAGIIVLLAFFNWYREISADLKSRIKFLPNRTLGTGLKTAVTLLILAASFSYYGFLVSGPNASEKFSNSLVATGSRAVQNVLEMYYQDKFSPKMTLDEFVANITDVLGDVNLDTGQKDLNEIINQGLNQAQQQLVIEARNDFLKTMGIEAAGSETMDLVVEKIVRKNMDKYLGSFQKHIPAILALGLFFLLNVFNFVYCELIKSFGYVIFHILAWLKFVKVKNVQVEAEKITL